MRYTYTARACYKFFCSICLLLPTNVIVSIIFFFIFCSLCLFRLNDVLRHSWSINILIYDKIESKIPLMRTHKTVWVHIENDFKLHFLFCLFFLPHFNMFQWTNQLGLFVNMQIFFLNENISTTFYQIALFIKLISDKNIQYWNNNFI